MTSTHSAGPRPKAVIYARAAGTTREDSGAAATQLVACRTLAALLGVEVCREFVDINESSAPLGRPGFRALLAFTAGHPIRYVLCADLAQLSADHVTSMEVLLRLHKRGAQVALAATEAVIEIHVGNPPAMPEDDKEAAA
ncbi:MAG: recombinase family protein [Propionibacteriales bacterium]|nr:recombinase family protein [Propionibacteriales bacterium]